MVLVAPPDLRPPRGLPARSSSAPRASLGASSRSPARPRRPRGALHIGGAWSLMCGSARRLVVWLGLAAAHGHRSQALPPPTGTAARPCCQPPFSPSHRTLIVEFTINFACNSLTALSNLEFAVLEFQRFQMLLTLLPIELHATLGDGWPCWGEVGSWGVTFLPCSACCRPERDKTRPARAKHTKFGAFVSAGRILSRTRPDMPRAGRRMSRLRVPQLGSQAMRRPSHQPRSGASECLAPSNFARNSLAATSNLEFTSLQLQRLWMVSKSDRGKLRAIFVWLGSAAARGRYEWLLCLSMHENACCGEAYTRSGRFNLF